MPPVAAAVGAIAGGLASAGGAVLAAGSSVLGGVAAAGGSVLGGVAAVGSSTLGGLTAAGTSVIGGISALTKKKEGEPTAVEQVVGIAKAGQQIYGMFQSQDEPTAAQPSPQLPTQAGSPASNILNTLPNFVRTQTGPQQQVFTTPAPTPSLENKFIKYAPWIAAAIAGYFLFLR